MKVLELFAGSCSFSNVANTYGFETLTTDIKQFGNIDIVENLFNLDYKNLNYKPDIIWASPDCSVYSMASGSKSFNKNKEPVSDKAKLHLKILDRLKECLKYHQERNPNLIYFVENPTARMVWFMEEFPRYDVSYCKYGYDRMKPTTIWTNKLNFNPKKCKKKDNCNHIKAPRGSRTGTQGIPKFQRYKVPENLIKELFSSCPPNLLSLQLKI